MTMNEKNKDKFLNGAIKAINEKQNNTIKKAEKIIGDVKAFEKNALKKLHSYN